jgi:hypothetical protein
MIADSQNGSIPIYFSGQAVLHVCQAEKSNEQHMLYPQSGRQWINPSKRLVDRAIERWNLQGPLL